MGIFSRRKSDEAQQETSAGETSVEATESVVGDIRPTALPKNEQLREGSGLHMLAELMRSKSKGQTTLELKQTGNDMNLAFFKDGAESESVIVVPGNEWFNGVAKLYTEEEKSERGAWTRALIVLDSGEGQNYSVQASYMNSETRQTHNLNYGSAAASLAVADSAESLAQEEKEESVSSSALSGGLAAATVAGGAAITGAVATEALATEAEVVADSATEAEEADPVSRLSSISERLSGSSANEQATETLSAGAEAEEVETEMSESFSALAFGKDEPVQETTQEAADFEAASPESVEVSAEAEEPAQTSATPLYDSLVAEGRISETEPATASSFFAQEAPLVEDTAAEDTVAEDAVSESSISAASAELSSELSASETAQEVVAEETPDYVTIADLPTAEQAIAARKQREQEQAGTLESASESELVAESVEEETEADEAESVNVQPLKAESDYVTSTYDFSGDDSLVEVDESAEVSEDFSAPVSQETAHEAEAAEAVVEETASEEVSVQAPETQSPEAEEAEVSSLVAGSAVVGGSALAGTAAAATFAAQDNAQEAEETEASETAEVETEVASQSLASSEETAPAEGEPEAYVQEIPEHIEDEWDEEPLTSSSLTGINAQVPANAVGYDVAPSYNMPTQPVFKPSKTRKAEGNLVLSEAEVVARLSGAQEALFGPNGTARDVSTVLIRVRTLGSYYDALTHVREAGLWAQKKTFDLIPEDVLNILQVKADSYKEGVGSPLAMSIRFTPGIPPVAAFDYANEEAFVKYNDHLPAQQYVEELRMFPRTGANIPEHMNQALTSWSF